MQGKERFPSELPLPRPQSTEDFGDFPSLTALPPLPSLNGLLSLVQGTHSLGQASQDQYYGVSASIDSRRLEDAQPTSEESLERNLELSQPSGAQSLVAGHRASPQSSVASNEAVTENPSEKARSHSTAESKPTGKIIVSTDVFFSQRTL